MKTKKIKDNLTDSNREQKRKDAKLLENFKESVNTDQLDQLKMKSNRTFESTNNLRSKSTTLSHLKDNNDIRSVSTSIELNKLKKINRLRDNNSNKINTSSSNSNFKLNPLRDKKTNGLYQCNTVRNNSI